MLWTHSFPKGSGYGLLCETIKQSTGIHLSVAANHVSLENIYKFLRVRRKLQLQKQFVKEPHRQSPLFLL